VSTPPSRRTTSLGALLIVVALAVSACGGSGADAADRPTTSAPTSASPTTATPTPTPTPTEAPLSPFEQRPQVQALRSWAAASAQDVNAHRREFPKAQQFEVDTDKVRQDVKITFHDDLDKYYPGPVPLTPIAVTGSGSRSMVTTCVIGAGFALTKPGGPVAEKRKVIPVVFTMAKERGAWRLAGIVLGTADCGGVRIKGVQW